MVHTGQEVIIIGGSHALHQHEKLAIAVSKAMRGHSLQETKTDGRFHVHTRTYLDGAILKEVFHVHLSLQLLFFVPSISIHPLFFFFFPFGRE
jgi:hypothetical protein